MTLFVKILNERIEGWGLIREGRLLDIPLSRVGAYSRERLIEALR